MPIYEYECQDERCGYKFEIMQTINTKDLMKCPECNRDTLRRIISLSSRPHFKGAGFYETDYKDRT